MVCLAVIYDAAHQYVTFKTRIPADSVATLKSLKPEEWIMATSVQHPPNETEPIVAVKPYVSSSGTKSN